MSVEVALVVDRTHLDLDPDDRPLAAALRARGHRVAAVAWDDPGYDWSAARLALLRNPWDYFHQPDAFLAWAARAAAATALWNPLPLVRWNLHKGYLLELAGRGAPVVPTRLLRRGDPTSLGQLLSSEGWDDAILKPAIGADSWQALRVGGHAGALTEGERQLATLVAERDVLVQPFLPSVEALGERCLVFVEGAYSHAVRKNALTRGGRWAGLPEGVPVAAADDELAAARAVLAAASAAIAAAGGSDFDEEWLYARVDLVRDADGQPLLLELELVEPTLFLADHPAGLARLVAGIERRLTR